MRIDVEFEETSQTFDATMTAELGGGAATPEQIAAAVKKYFEDNPIEGGSVSAEEVERIVEEYLAENPPGISGGAAKWELLQEVNVPLDAEETWNFDITFPRGYDDYLLIANTAATSTNANSIIYPSPLVINQENNTMGGTWAFWDYYPGTTAQRFNLLFEKIEANGVVYCRMSGIAPTNALGKPNGIADSGWFSYDSYPGTPRKLVGWNGVKISRLIAPGSNYVLLGRKSL